MNKAFEAIGDIINKNMLRKQTKFFMVVGLGFMTWNVFKFGFGIWKMTHWMPAHFRNRKEVNETSLKQSYGANCYALVTGCTEGIGLAYTI